MEVANLVPRVSLPSERAMAQAGDAGTCHLEFWRKPNEVKT